MRRHAKAPFAGSIQAVGNHHSLFGLACLCVLGLVALLGTGLPAASAAEDFCPNAKFRTGPSANLPECRAYELVSPPEKNGGATRPGAVLDGDHVYFQGTNPFFDDELGFGVQPTYLATRGDDGWATKSGVAGSNSPVADFNSAFSQEVITQNVAQQLLPSDTDFARDVFIRTATGLTQVSLGSLGGNSEDPATYAGQSADGARIFFQTSEHLEPADADRTSGKQLYERYAGTTRVVGLDSEEHLIGTSGAVLANGTGTDPGACIEPPSGGLSGVGIANPISKDGMRVFFTSPDPCSSGEPFQLYVRKDADETSQVSKSQCDRAAPACDDAGYSANFQGADLTGSIVYFTSAGQLTNDDVDAATDLYRFNVDTGDLDRITLFADPSGCLNSEQNQAPCRVNFVSAMAADGRRVYFVAEGVAATGGSATGASLYLFDQRTGQVSFVTPFEGNYLSSGYANPPLGMSFSEDGNTLVFQSSLRLTSFDNEGSTQVYRYRADTHALACVSCNSFGMPPIASQGSQDFGVSGDIKQALEIGRLSGPVGGLRVGRQLVSEDGDTVVFRSLDRLVPEDKNDQYDAYVWHNGSVTLLSLGSGSGPSAIMGISPDGRDIFISTPDRLVDADPDFQADIYDARIGGGLAADHPVPVAPCAGDLCRGPSSAPPSDSSAASATFAGPGNPGPARKARCPKHKARRGGHCLKKAGHARKDCRKPDGRVRRHCIDKRIWYVAPARTRSETDSGGVK